MGPRATKRASRDLQEQQSKAPKALWGRSERGDLSERARGPIEHQMGSTHTRNAPQRVEHTTRVGSARIAATEQSVFYYGTSYILVVDTVQSTDVHS